MPKEEVKNQEAVVTTKHHPNWLWPVAIVGAFVVLAGTFSVGLVAGHFGPRGFDRLGPGIKQEMRGHMGGEFGYRVFLRNPNESQLRGVVTNVSGGNFTLAGGGTTNTVTTNSSTQYTGASKVAVNDSVVVLGTVSNGTFTATHVIVNP